MFGRVIDLVFPTMCPGCGARADPVCADCAATFRPAPAVPLPPGLDAWVAPYAYDGVVRDLVTGVKYRQARAALPWLAGAVAAAVAGACAPGSLDALTWAPTTPARRRRRGFDHAELLARSVGSALGLEARATLRREHGPPQTGRSSTARRVGPRFEARRAAPARVLLLDDVATTGATLAAAARVLRGAGARRVVAATVARTPPRAPASAFRAK